MEVEATSLFVEPQNEPRVSQQKEANGNSSINFVSDFGAKECGVQLNWRSLSYSIEETIWKLKLKPVTRSTKVILQNINGKIESETLTAVIGPSGAGKSTLLELLAGRRRAGLKGSILVNSDDGDYKVGIAFMAQKDYFLNTLTIRECLTIASRLKNYKEAENFKHKLIGKTSKKGDIQVIEYSLLNKARRYHQDLVQKIIEELNLDSCADVRIGNCSGGQQKRLSIAVELISKPDILILDEPTSGLDSFSAFQCVQLLKKLASTKSLAIIASIHQPSSQTLGLFNNLYVLSHNGHCIYNGPTSELLQHMSINGLICPTYYNPADFMTEIASGDFGKEAILEMAKIEEERHENVLFEGIKLSKAMDKMRRKRLPVLNHTWILLKRASITTFREPLLTSLRLVQYLFVAFVMGLVFSASKGKGDGCFKWYHKEVASSVDFQTLSDFQKEESLTTDNLSFLFFNLLFLFLASMMATVMTFPLEMGVFLKETSNHWYTCGTYYVARTLADAPFQVLFPSIYAVIIYRMTGQLEDNHRFYGFILLNILVSFIAQSKGLLIGAIYANQVNAAVFTAPVCTIPFILFGGFFVNLKEIPPYLKPLSAISYFKYGFDAFVGLIYGFDRCNATETYDRTPNVTDNPLNSLNFVLKKLNLTLAETTSLLEFYLDNSNVDSETAREVMAEMEKVTNSTAIHNWNTMRSGLNLTSPSYIMSHFNLSDDVFIDKIIALLVFLLVFRLTAYLVLLFRSKQRK